MVMKRNAMVKNLTQSIRRSFGRYAAIVAIIALGAGLFVGLLMTKQDMVATGQRYMDEQNMFDLRLLNNYGWTEENLTEIKALDGVADAEGSVSMDLIARFGDREDDLVYRFYSIPQSVSRVDLRGGRMPQADNECLADGFRWDDRVLGKTVTLADSNSESALDSVKYKTFTIVGYVATPLYMDMNRGTTSVGSGTLANYFYVPAGAFDVDYYTEIQLTLPENHPIYTQRYQDAVDAAADKWEPELEVLAQKRCEQVKIQADEEFRKGWQEYLDGVREANRARDDAKKQLADALRELEDGEKKLEESRKTLEDSEKQLEKGKKELDSKQLELNITKTMMESQMKTGLELIAKAREVLEKQLTELEGVYLEALDTLEAVNAELEAVDAERREVQAQIDELNAQIARLEQEPGYEFDPEYLSALASRQVLEIRMGELDAARAALVVEQTAAQKAVEGYEALGEAGSALDQKEAELYAGKKQLEDGQKQLDAAKRQLEASEKKLAQGWEEFRRGEEDLKAGWADYENGKLEAEEGFEEANAELKKAREALSQARRDIAAMEDSRLYILDRTSNPGYNNLDSSSDIVAGVSRVMPVFFLLVASLVCITTMTRMIDEERTQIGTLKALGYSNAAIIGKYLAYSGTGAVIGCGLGVAAGSLIFPQILWKAYCIMLYIEPRVALTVNWPLCIGVVVLYTAVMLFVTWYSCHKTLAEVPAELIRPKAPDPGKKIFLEHFSLWQKIPFLDKVSIRNIFRYRQRLAMMLVGIGGCTALLLTGFGLRDSIVNVVDYQYAEVTKYDMSVYFREGVTAEDREKFLAASAPWTDDAMFYHQSSVDLLFEDGAKGIYMLAGGDEMSRFISLHHGETPLNMPGQDEVLLSVGAAKALGIHVGDTVQLRSADLKTLDLTVTGIYDNHIYNYAIVSPRTIEDRWGETPELQMAFLTVRENTDVHSLGAKLSEEKFVLNVEISQDVADAVGSMMEALDLVVMVIVFSAGLLAVTVLYNLTNINLGERIREIATIKVLGFNARETSAYVFKENMTLTVAGALIGLPLGMGLLLFVMSQIKIDMVWFKAIAHPLSFLYAIALTFLAAVAVNCIFYFKLEKINMAEALKSVE